MSTGQQVTVKVDLNTAGSGYVEYVTPDGGVVLNGSLGRNHFGPLDLSASADLQCQESLIPNSSELLFRYNCSSSSGEQDSGDFYLKGDGKSFSGRLAIQGMSPIAFGLQDCK